MKCIFTYSEPLEAALSVEGMRHLEGSIWVEEHIFNLVGRGNVDDLYQRDVLNYQGQIGSWAKTQRVNVLVLKYDQLWERNPEISRFSGYNVILPSRRDR